MSNESKQPFRRLAAGAVAVITAASMLAGGIFHSPANMPEDGVTLPPPIVLDEDDLDGDGKNKKNPPPENVEPEPETAPETVAPAEQEPALPEEEKRGLRRWWGNLRFSQRLLLIPLAALLGWGLFTLAAAFLPGLLGKIVAWLATLAALAFGFIATEKAIFPDIPIKKLLRSRNFAGLVVGLVSLGAADLVLPLVWSGYSKLELLFHALGLVLVFTGAGVSFARRTKREEDRARLEGEAAKPETEPEPEPEEPRPLTREDILAIADTVSRKRT